MVKMTKWKRLRRRKERIRAEKTLTSGAEEQEEKLAQPEKITENIQQYQEPKKSKSIKTSKPNTILAQIPRYIYLVAIFALLAGVFFPLITPGVSFDFIILGTATLFLGLVGTILLFKAVTSDKMRGIFIAVGFALITISLVLIYLLEEAFRSVYF